MAFDETLAQRIRDALAQKKGAEEKKLLGGIGFLISYHRTLFDTGHVYFGMLLALLVAVGVNVALTRLDRRVGSWREQAEV